MRGAKSRLRVLVLALVLAIAGAGEAFACRDDGSGRPQVGLVLSGGGALGASQIGVLKAIEENHVPIHCVAGTSMGAVIGGLYASGYNSDQIRQIFSDADWGRIILGTRPYREQGFRAKDQARAFLSRYVLGVTERGLNPPSGIGSLRGMRRFLGRNLAVAGHDTNFDDLPTPFRAVATDLSTGETVAVSRGDIVDAIVASNSVPGVYPAQLVNGRALIDGGMSNQVPIDIAREMGADIVIVVDTSLPPEEFVNRSPSALRAVNQLVRLQVWQNRQRQMRLLRTGDVVITPDMTAFSSRGFDQINAGYEVGYSAALAVAGRFREIASIAAPPLARPPVHPETINVAAVHAPETSGLSETMITRRFAVRPGGTASSADIEAGLDRVNAIGMFDTVGYRVMPGPVGQDIQILTTPLAARQNLQLGLRLSSTLDGDSSYFGILGRWSYKPSNELAGEINLTTELGTDVALDLEWQQPIKPSGRVYFETGVTYEERTVPVNVDEERIAERRDGTAQVRGVLGREIGAWALVSIGAYAVDLDSDIIVGSASSLGAQSGTYGGAKLRLAADTLNSLTFPSQGVAADLNIGGFVNSEDDREATLATVTLSGARVIDGIGAFIRYDGGYLDQDAEGLPSFTLGGFKRLSGFQDNSIPSTQYNLLRIEAYKRMGADLEASFGVPVYIGGTLEGAIVDLDIADLSFHREFYAGSLYGAIDTPLGPAYLAFGLGEAGRTAIYLYFGQNF